MPVSYTHLDVYKRQELYYKKSDGLARVRPLNPDPSHGNQGSDDFYSLFTGDGRTYGIDLTLLYKKKKVEASVLYTLSKIEERYAMLFNGSYFTPQDDRRHQLKASGTYSFGKFRASTLITYKSKACLLYTSILSALSLPNRLKGKTADD